MQVSLTRLPNSRARLKIQLSALAMSEYFQKALQRLALSISVEGFRKGKAPLELAQKKIEEERVNEAALELALSSSYYAAIKQEGLVPLTEPVIRILQFGREEGFVYEAEVDVLPEVILGDYRKLKIPKKKVETVKEEEIEQVLKQIQRQTAVMKLKEGCVEKGDFVEIDFESFLDSRPLEGGQSQNHPLVVGQGQFVPAFEEQLLGMKKGETKEFKVKFEKDFPNKQVAGQEIRFKVTVKELKKIELPPLNDEWAVSLGRKNLADLKERIKESLKQEKEKQSEAQFEEELLNQILKISQIDLPKSLILAEQGRLLGFLKNQIEEKGLAFEDYLASIKKTEEELAQDLEKVAERNVKISLLLKEIGQKEKIQCPPEKFEKELSQLREIKKEVTEEDQRRLKIVLEAEETLAFLKKLYDPSRS